MRIYVASSWRNKHQPNVVATLIALGHDVYDFRVEGFSWSQIPGTRDWTEWTVEENIHALTTVQALAGFNRDQSNLEGCDLCVMVLPCGKSSHLELGHAVGHGKKTIIYMPEKQEPELMYLMASKIVTSVMQLVSEVEQYDLEKDTAKTK